MKQSYLLDQERRSFYRKLVAIGSYSVLHEQMRKFFSFKSSGSGTTNGQGVALPPAPPLSDDSVCLEKVGGRRSSFSVGRDQNLSQSSKDATLKPLNQYPENEDSSRLPHRRSHSFSSSAVNRISRGGNAISWSDLSRSTFSARNSPQNPANRPRE